MTDTKELLELAALAAGIDHVGVVQDGATILSDDGRFAMFDRYWNPLVADGDAFRLAAALLINIGFIRSSHSVPHAFAKTAGGDVFFEIEENHESLEAAARLAIVRCAAQIGRKMKEAGQ